jgi:homoserine kinase
MRLMDTVTTRVPASTSNLGPGFDCLGIALAVSNRVSVRRGPLREQPRIATEAAREFFEVAKLDPFPFEWQVSGEVPRSRGMGSSVTVRLGIMHGLNRLGGNPLDRTTLFELCTKLEGHPDNAAPAAFGGFTLARAGAQTIRAEVSPALKFVLLIPDFEVSTPKARSILPAQIPRLEAVMSSANACRITAAFLTHRYDLLRDCFADGLHQPYRERLIPFLTKVISAAVKTGALGGFLSGSGSTICCLATENEGAIGEAMLAASGNAGARILVTTADNDGATIQRIE